MKVPGACCTLCRQSLSIKKLQWASSRVRGRRRDLATGIPCSFHTCTHAHVCWMQPGLWHLWFGSQGMHQAPRNSHSIRRKIVFNDANETATNGCEPLPRLSTFHFWRWIIYSWSLLLQAGVKTQVQAGRVLGSGTPCCAIPFLPLWALTAPWLRELITRSFNLDPGSSQREMASQKASILSHQAQTTPYSLS